MKSKIKKICIYTMILGLFLLIAAVSSAVPVLKTMELDPAIPEPEDTVTFTTEIDFYDYVDKVYLIVEECKEGFCYTDSFNESMDDQGDGKFETQITLKHDDATEIKYYVNIKTIEDDDIDWTKSTVVTLDLDTSGGGDNNDDANNNTPGFELILLVVSAVIGLILLRRKR